MKMSKKWPRASALLLVMLLCLSILSVPAYAKTDVSKAITASSDSIEEAVVPTVEHAASEPVKETEPEAAVPLTPEELAAFIRAFRETGGAPDYFKKQEDNANENE